jgi:hypothetical protein
LGILSSVNLTYDPSIWLKVTFLSSTASKRKVILVLGLMETSSSVGF